MDKINGILNKYNLSLISMAMHSVINPNLSVQLNITQHADNRKGHLNIIIILILYTIHTIYTHYLYVYMYTYFLYTYVYLILYTFISR